MPVTIEIPTAFRRFTAGAPKVDCSANTIAEALTELDPVAAHADAELRLEALEPPAGLSSPL